LWQFGKLGHFYCFSHSRSCPRLDQEEMPRFHWKKANGQRIRQIRQYRATLVRPTTSPWDAIRNTRQNRPTSPSRRLLCYRYGMICHRSSLMRQSCHFERDFDRVLLQLVNNQFKYREAADIHHWNVWTVDEKVVQSFIHYYWIFRTRLHVHLKKWTLKFKLLYLLNHVCYLIKKCAGYVAWILSYKHCKFGEKICYNSRDIEFFLWDYFFGAPCISM